METTPGYRQRIHRQQQENSGALKSHQAPQEPLHEAKQVHGLRNRGGRDHHRSTGRLHCLRPRYGDGEVQRRLQDLARQARYGQIPGLNSRHISLKRRMTCANGNIPPAKGGTPHEKPTMLWKCPWSFPIWHRTRWRNALTPQI